MFDSNPAVGFTSLGQKYSTAIANGQILPPAKSMEQMQAVAFNAYTNATLTVIFLLVVFSVMFYAFKVSFAALRNPDRTDRETPFQPVPTAATAATGI